MSEYSAFYIGDYLVDSWRNGIGGEVAVLFTEGDWRKWVNERDVEDEPHNDLGGELRSVAVPGGGYKSTAGILAERLDVMGYTLPAVQRAFAEGIEQSIKNAHSMGLDYHLLTAEQETNPALARYHLARAQDRIEEFYSGLTFDVWCDRVRRMMAEPRPRLSQFNSAVKIPPDTDIYFLHVLLEANDRETFMGFPTDDYLHVYRAIVANVDPDTPVLLDCSDLLDWVPQENFTPTPIQTIVLTEGSSDVALIGQSIRVFFPHLCDYFSFMDFHLSNAQGGTSQLLNIVRAFIATSIRHRIVAIFDNDTAGHEAFRQLRSTVIPENIRVMTLPDLPLAECYPTVGPQGLVEMDVNGSCASLEMYLGRDILTTDEGALTLVEWKGYVRAMEQYQGEVRNKSALQERYLDLMSRAATDPSALDGHDSAGMMMVLKRLFSVFQDGADG
ncbi:MAG: hypothetical protein NVSMB52_06970 [Chloroflexota bacterium]